jgi:hypothetical protein
MAFPLNPLPIFYMLFPKSRKYTFWQDLLALYFGQQSYCLFFGDNLERKVQKREKQHVSKPQISVLFLRGKFQTGVTKQKSSATWYKGLLWEKKAPKSPDFEGIFFFPMFRQ